MNTVDSSVNYTRIGRSFAIGALLACAAPVAAQAPLQVHTADMSVPFGVSAVQLVLVSDHLLVVDGNEPTETFAIDRSNVDGVARDGDVVTLSLRAAVRGKTDVRFRTAAGTALARWANSPGSGTRSADTRTASPDSAAGNARVTLQAQHDHLIRGNCVGQLMISDDRISFESLTDIDHSRQWFYADIREVKQDGIYKLSITPFLNNGYDFELIGRGLNSREYGQIVDAVGAARSR